MTPASNPLPKLFIGSSSERMGIVDAFAKVLSRHADCIPWNIAPEFKTRGSFTTFNALCDAARAYDFALFILTADDVLTHRKRKYMCPRDNVVFEMGLFIGNIGPERVLAVLQNTDKPPMKIPTDLSAVNMPRFSYTEEDSQASIASINAEIQGFVKTIKDLQFRRITLNLATGWGFMAEDRHFEVRLGAGQLAEARSTIGNRRIAIAARIDNPVVNFEDDEHVAFSPSRQLPEPLNDMVFRIPEKEFRESVRKGAKIQGRVVLVPPGRELASFETLRVAVQQGCSVLEPISAQADANVTP